MWTRGFASLCGMWEKLEIELAKPPERLTPEESGVGGAVLGPSVLKKCVLRFCGGEGFDESG